MSRALLVAVLAVLTIGAGRSGDVQGSVIYVVDGDTIHVRIDNHVEKVRYLGIDAPEVPHPRGDAHRGHDRRRPRFFPNTPAAGDAARRVNIELVSGKHVRLTFDRERRDAYKRLLAYVWVGDTLINAEMVSRGYAEVVRTPTDLVYRAKFLQLQDEARQAGRGLWQASAKLKGAGEERSHGRSGR